MNWSTLIGITAIVLVIAFSWLRAEKSRRRIVNGFIVLPGGIVMLLYAWVYNQWLALGIGIAIAAGVVGAWWFAYGSYLPPPTSDSIKVWGQEAKIPPQSEPASIAALEKEVQRLKEEKERMEEELKRLKAKQNGK